jgi:hypothetical protein
MKREEIKSNIDLTVKKIKNATQSVKEEDILGFEIAKYPNYHIFAVAPTASGKTTALLSLVKKIMDKDTRIHLFCHTVNSDKNWLWFQDYMKKKNRELNIYDDMASDLPLLIETFKEEAKELQDKKEELEQLETELEEKKKLEKEEKQQGMKVDMSKPIDLFKVVETKEDDDEIKIRIKVLKNELRETKKEKVANKHIIIFDDISREIAKNEYFTELLKESRHFGARVIISSQNGLDISPSGRMQLKILMLFGNIPKTKLQQIYNSIDMGMTFDEFEEYYKEATKNKYEFLTMYLPEQEYRCCFDKLLKKDF